MTCNCTGECMPLVAVKCTSCKWGGEERVARAEGLKVGEKMPMGVLYRCPNRECNRRSTCVGTVKEKGQTGCSKIS